MAGEFVWNGQRLEYFDHPYNHTALNMRRVEIPIVRWFVGQCPPGARILEVGNVMAHYGLAHWPVVDLHERGAIHADVMNWRPARLVNLLVSISTIEHIGFGRDAGPKPVSPSAALAQFRSFLAPGGKAVATAPTGYNPALDAELKSGELGADCIWFMRMVGDGKWAECTMDEALAMSPRACSGRWSGGMVLILCERDSSLRSE